MNNVLKLLFEEIQTIKKNYFKLTKFKKCSCPFIIFLYTY